MRIILRVFLLIQLSSILAAVPQTRGLYVNDFINILGSETEENKLLNFAYTNGFNYLVLYQMSQVHDQYNIITPEGDKVLSSFILKAKSQYHFRIGASSENPATFLNILTEYQRNQTDPLKKFDVFYFEFEFWLDFRCEPGASSKYCERYLEPNGFSCDTAGGYKFFIKSLRYIDSLANANGIISQTYIGQIDAVQACEIAHACDEILLHSYRTDDVDLYTYTRKRLAMLGACGKRVTVIPIFHSGPDYMATWLMDNSLQKPYRLYDVEFMQEPEAWASNIDLAGYHWYSWEDLKNKNIRPLPEIQLIAPSGNVELSLTGDISLKAEITQRSATILSVNIAVYDSTGKLVISLPLSSPDSIYQTSFIPPYVGRYSWQINVFNSRFVDHYSEVMNFYFSAANDPLHFPDSVFNYSGPYAEEEPLQIRISSMTGSLIFEGKPAELDRALFHTSGMYMLYEQFPDKVIARKIFLGAE